MKIAWNDLADAQIRAWIKDSCLTHEREKSRVGTLYAEYQKWTLNTQQRTYAKKAFSQSLERNGFMRYRAGQGVRMIAGISLMQPHAHQL